MDISADFTLHLQNRLTRIFDSEFSVFIVISRCSGICDFFFLFLSEKPKLFQVISLHSQLGLLDGRGLDNSHAHGAEIRIIYPLFLKV